MKSCIIVGNYTNYDKYVGGIVLENACDILCALNEWQLMQTTERFDLYILLYSSVNDS